MEEARREIRSHDATRQQSRVGVLRSPRPRYSFSAANPTEVPPPHTGNAAIKADRAKCPKESVRKTVKSMAKPMTTLVRLLLVLLAAAFIAAPAPALAFQAELGRYWQALDH